MPSYLRLTGTKQGKIKGGVVQKGREGQVEVHALDHALIRADPSAVGPSRLGHGALHLTKHLDRSSPQFYAALVGGETMSECIIDVLLPQARTIGMADVLAYTIRLTDAVVTGVALSIVDIAAPVADKRPPTETISLAYKAIEWTWVDGSITASATH